MRATSEVSQCQCERNIVYNFKERTREKSFVDLHNILIDGLALTILTT